jgi:hypothetical protein
MMIQDLADHDDFSAEWAIDSWLWRSSSGLNRGIVARMSLPCSKVVLALMVPVRNPLPRGL